MKTTNKPEVVAWRWRKPIVNDHGETVGGVWKLGGAPAFLPWWTNEPLIRLSDYEALQAEYEGLLKHLQNLIDQTTPLVPDPDRPGWSRRIQLDEVIAERDSLRAEREKLVEALELMVTTHDERGWPTAAVEIARAALEAHRKGGDK